ncbi:MAG: membrane protein insertion efficiency factor YidD [Candidatus Babeliaceae bacterium]|nr:membrane protein insertion efficiency factor YidD [Candidatus Babeliaceae bacterium]
MSRSVAYLLVACIMLLRPLLGPGGCCRFEVTCTRYACQQLLSEPLLKAIKNIIIRLFLCQPCGNCLLRRVKCMHTDGFRYPGRR